MAGQLITIVGKQAFSLYFANVSPAPTVILGNRCYDTRDAVTGVLIVRVYSLAVPAGSFTVNMINQMEMPDDPGTLYTGTPIVGMNLSGTVPFVQEAAWSPTTSPPCGPMVALQLVATWGGTGGMGNITVGVDLLIRDT